MRDFRGQGDTYVSAIGRLADIGSTDVTAAPSIFSALPRHLGYHSEITVLLVPITCASLKNRDIDVFLGNSMPSWRGRVCDEFGPVERRQDYPGDDPFQRGRRRG